MQEGTMQGGTLQRGTMQGGTQGVWIRKVNLFSDSFQQRGIGNHQVNVQSLSSLRNLREKILG